MAIDRRKIIVEFEAKGKNLKQSFDNFNKKFKSFNDNFDGIKKEADKFAKDISKSFKDFGNNINDLSKKIKSIDFSNITKQIKSIDFKSLFSGLNISGIISSVTSSFSALLPMFGAVGAAAAGVGTAFFGIREAFRTINIEPVQGSFKELTAGLGETGNFLNELKDASAGTIRNFDLMKSTNLALAGSTGEVKKTFGEALPDLLKVARTQSAATGENVQFLFDSLVTGIKRTSPRLIDNTGLIVKVGDANREYAKSIGKSVEELSAQEKQIALINATLKAGNTAIDEVGGIILTNANRLDQIRTTLANLRDEFGLAFQPIITIILDLGRALATSVASAIRPFINGLRIINEAIFAVFNAIRIMLAPVIALSKSIIRLFNSFSLGISGINGFKNLVLAFANTVNFLLSPLKVLTGTLNFIADIVEHSMQRFRDLISVFSVVGTIIRVAAADWLKPIFQFRDRLTTTVSQLVTIIKFHIDQFILGAARLFGSWTAEIINARTFIIKVVADLANSIGDFLIGFSPAKKGALSKIDVGGRNIMLAWLEGFTSASLQPVSEVASEVTKLLEPVASLTLSQIEKRFQQLDAAVQPFIDRVKILEAQLKELKEPTEQALDAIDKQQQKLIESFNQGNFEIAKTIRAFDKQKEALIQNLDVQEKQLSNAKFQLALKRSEQAEERALLEIRKNQLGTQEKTAKTAKKIREQEKKQRKETKPSTGKGEAQEQSGVSEERFEDLPEAVSEQIKGLSDFGQKALGEFGVGYLETFDSKELEKQQERLEEGTQKISEGLTSGISGKLIEPFSTAISDIQSLFTDDLTVGEWITTALSGISGLITAPFNTGLFLVKQAFRKLRDFITLPSYEDEEGGQGFLASLNNLKNTIYENTLLPLVNKFDGAKDLIVTALALTTPIDDIASDFQTMLNTLSPKINLASTFFENLKDDIVNFFGNIDWTDLFVKPVVDGFNNALSAIEGFLQKAVNAYNSLAESPFGVGLTPTDFTPTIPKINLDSLEGAAKGGQFSKGLLRVGERGEEIISSANKLNVFPNSMVQAIDNFNRLFDSGMITDIGSSTTMSTSNQTIINNNNDTFSPTINTNNSAGLSVRELDSLRR